MIDFEIKLDPKGLQRLAGKLQQYVGFLEAKSRDALIGAGEIYCEIVISHMGEYTGDEMVFSDTFWQSLSKRWLAEKRAKGQVEEIWEATGETKRSVRVHSVQKTEDGWKVFAGLQGVSMEVLQRALENEFGSTVMAGGSGISGTTMYVVPARPLFEPAKRELMHVPSYRQMVVGEFAKAMKAAYQSFAYGKP
jgi:hypothetical protein